MSTALIPVSDRVRGHHRGSAIHGPGWQRAVVALTGICLLGTALSGCTAAGPATTTSPTSKATTAASTTADPLPLMQGTWVYSTSVADMQASGVTDAGFQDENAATTVMTIHGNRFSLLETPEKGFQVSDPTGSGTLTSSGGVVTIHWSESAEDRTSAVPHRNAHGGLMFTGLKSFASDPQVRALDHATFLRRAWLPLSTAIEGRWNIALTEQDLQLAGATASDVGAQVGSSTLTLTSGRWTLQRTKPPTGQPASSSGAYTLQDGRIIIHWSDRAGDTTSATVSPTPEGGLVLGDPKEGSGRSKAVAVYDRAAFSGGTWTGAN